MMISTEVDVELDEFPEEEILEAAYEIIEADLKNPKGLSVAGLALSRLLADTDDGLPPASTAAKIKSMGELIAWREREGASH